MYKKGMFVYLAEQCNSTVSTIPQSMELYKAFLHQVSLKWPDLAHPLSQDQILPPPSSRISLATSRPSWLRIPLFLLLSLPKGLPAPHAPRLSLFAPCNKNDLVVAEHLRTFPWANNFANGISHFPLSSQNTIWSCLSTGASMEVTGEKGGGGLRSSEKCLIPFKWNSSPNATQV